MIPLAAIAALAPMLMQAKQQQGQQQNQPDALERANMMSMPGGGGQFQQPAQQGHQMPGGGPMGPGGMGGTYQPPMMAGSGYQAPGLNHQGAMTMSAAPWGGGSHSTGAQFTTGGVGGGMTSLF
jgi:hypothetical protein